MEDHRPTIPPEVSIAPEQRRFQILALTGGGYRGLFTAVILEHLEAQAKRPLAQVFDLIAGTSVGGILAIGLAAGITAKKLKETLEQNGPLIFQRPEITWHPKSWGRAIPKSVAQAVTHLYDAEPLRNAIAGALADKRDVSLKDIQVPLLVPAVSYVNASHKMFRSAGLAGSEASADTLLDVALATSAAPTYFPAQELAGDRLVDGGLVANAPDFVAFTDACKFLKVKAEKIHIMSIGTAGTSAAKAAGKTPKGGFGWIRGGLIELVMAAQEELALELCHAHLPGRFWRIDRAPGPDMKIIRPFDEATAAASDTLRAIAADVVGKDLVQPGLKLAVRQFLEHTPLRHSAKAAQT
jgi:predicted acylesterase/phospholipase RssA